MKASRVKDDLAKDFSFRYMLWGMTTSAQMVATWARHTQLLIRLQIFTLFLFWELRGVTREIVDHMRGYKEEGRRTKQIIRDIHSTSPISLFLSNFLPCYTKDFFLDLLVKIDRFLFSSLSVSVHSHLIVVLKFEIRIRIHFRLF